jgi:hypothetical protein
MSPGANPVLWSYRSIFLATAGRRGEIRQRDGVPARGTVARTGRQG